MLKKKYNANDAVLNIEKDTSFSLSINDSSFITRKEKNPDHFAIVGMDIPYLRHPTFLDACVADRDLVQKYLIPAINYMAENVSEETWNIHQGFEPYEFEKFKRIVINILYYIKDNENSENVQINHAKFFDFVNDIDSRHGSNFLETFPEMVSFYEKCKNERTHVYAT